MKKILSLVLAVLMLASLAVSTSAVKILNSEGTGFIKTNPEDEVTVGELLDVYEMLGLTLPYGGSFTVGGETIHTWWYDDCPVCDGFSFHYVDDGDIKWKCLESNCGKSGVISWKDDKDDKEDEKDDADYVDDDEMFVGPKCTTCKKSNTYFDKVVIRNGKLQNRYYCFSCKAYFYTDLTSSSVDEDDVREDYIDAVYKCSKCSKYAEFDYFYTFGDNLYARYSCSAGHEIDKRVYADIDFDDDNYKVRVICTYGGDYDITGTNKAYYGEKKTIEFYPNKGYVLTDVLVDGESVDVTDNKITITVKRNTIVRAYFEKESKLASYTITADATGNGRITAKKNGESVTAAKVSAKYTDSVVYRFIPASDNYYVKSVKVNGKSVGAVSSYTVSKINEKTDIKVTFAWENPFEDVKSAYLDAVEYVTESGIMSAAVVQKDKEYFYGNVKATVQAFAVSLAEMADTADKLDSDDERLLWAIKQDLVDKDADLTATCDVQTACAMVRAFLEALEDINDISFVDLDAKDSVKETAIAIDMVTSTTYDNNRNLNRYDLASVCYLVAGLEYED